MASTLWHLTQTASLRPQIVYLVKLQKIFFAPLSNSLSFPKCWWSLELSNLVPLFFFLSKQNKTIWAFLVAQWSRNHLPVKEHGLDPWSGEESTCLRSSWLYAAVAWAHAKPAKLHQESHCNKKPKHGTRKTCAAVKTQCSKNTYIINSILKLNKVNMYYFTWFLWLALLLLCTYSLHDIINSCDIKYYMPRIPKYIISRNPSFSLKIDRPLNLRLNFKVTLLHKTIFIFNLLFLAFPVLFPSVQDNNVLSHQYETIFEFIYNFPSIHTSTVMIIVLSIDSRISLLDFLRLSLYCL